MTPKENPQEIRRRTEELTGLKTIGVVEKISHAKGSAYKLKVQGGSLLFVPAEGGCIITMDDQRFMWSDIPSDKTKIGIQVIDMIVGGMGKRKLHPTFKKMVIDVAQDIERKTYDTDVGDITLHSRRHPLGTEIVIEIVEGEYCLQCIWEKATGGINTREMKKMDKVPF